MDIWPSNSPSYTNLHALLCYQLLHPSGINFGCRLKKQGETLRYIPVCLVVLSAAASQRRKILAAKEGKVKGRGEGNPKKGKPTNETLDMV